MLSRAHPLLQRVRALRRDRALRDAEGVFLTEGIHLAQEALNAAADVELALVSDLLRRVPEGEDLLRDLAAARVRVEEVPPALLDTLQDARSPQPILLLVRRRRLGLETVLDEGRPGVPLIVIAHGVQDPGNLGGILRSADAAGASGLLASGSGADLYHPRTVRATMGSLFRLPSAAAPIEEILRGLAARDVPAVATDLERGVPFERHDFRGPTALILGSEGGGLGAELVARCAASVRIPMVPGVDSLSVGAAAAVLLFEAARQRSRGA